MTSYALCQKGSFPTFQIVRSFPKMTALDNVVTAIIYGGGDKCADPVKKST